MNARPRLLLTAIFLFGMAVTAVTLAAIGRIAEAGDSARDGQRAAGSPVNVVAAPEATVARGL